MVRFRKENASRVMHGVKESKFGQLEAWFFFLSGVHACLALRKHAFKKRKKKENPLSKFKKLIAPENNIY